MSEAKIKIAYLSEDRILATPEFISRNNLSLQSSKSIREKYDTVKENDFFGFASQVYFEFIDWEDCKDLYQAEYIQDVESGKEKFEPITDIMEAAQDFLDYMNFAWGKAQDKRGISASRSITKLSAWLWIMGRPDLSEEIEKDELYNPYGASALISICEKMGINVPASLYEFSKNKL